MKWYCYQQLLLATSINEEHLNGNRICRRQSTNQAEGKKIHRFSDCDPVIVHVIGHTFCFSTSSTSRSINLVNCITYFSFIFKFTK